MPENANLHTASHRKQLVPLHAPTNHEAVARLKDVERDLLVRQHRRHDKHRQLWHLVFDPGNRSHAAALAFPLLRLHREVLEDEVVQDPCDREFAAGVQYATAHRTAGVVVHGAHKAVVAERVSARRRHGSPEELAADRTLEVVCVV